MLPPALLLPPVQGLLTPRSDRSGLPACLGPATRRSGAYRDGTFTRWNHGACLETFLKPQPELSLVVRTHHE